MGGGTNCVVDGDTAWIDGTKVRIADIDAPETHSPHCASEAALGDRATVRMAELINAGPFEMASIDRDEDRYGRKLRILIRGGKSLGDQLVNDGLARPYAGGRRSWCHE
jgi:endonuclease YncB( thermonuclease family)